MKLTQRAEEIDRKRDTMTLIWREEKKEIFKEKKEKEDRVYWKEKEKEIKRLSESKINRERERDRVIYLYFYSLSIPKLKKIITNKI